MRLFFGDAANTRRFNGRWASSGGSTATAGYLPQAMPEGAWTTLEMRRVGADFQLLQDDVVIETRAVPGGAGATVNITSDLFFGCRATSSNGSLNGYIDDIEVYRGETLVASLSGETLG